MTQRPRRPDRAGAYAVAISIALFAPAACAAIPAAPAPGPADQLSTGPQPVSGSEPAPPAVYLDTHFVQPTGRKIRVEPDDRAGMTGGLQTALDQAQPGDAIELRAGGTYTGNFVLPAKPGAEWILVRAVNATLPAEGTRVGLGDAAGMPRILTPNSAPAISTAPGAHHFRLVGLEIGLAPGVAANGGVVIFGDAGQTSTSEIPHDLILDRCYVHGAVAADVRRGVVLNSVSSAVVDSYVSDIHSVDVDSQAILGWCGPGPFKIVNNYLEASGENTLFGGADPKIPGLVPADIEFRRNYSAKPLAWRVGDPAYAGRAWDVKNLFELKNARRVLVENNLFENNWPEHQNGIAILFTVRNQDGAAPWSVVEDVTFTGNTVRRAAGGVNILGRDNANPSAQGGRIAIRNNLFDAIGPAGWETPGRFLVISDVVNVVVDHNTILHTGNVVTAYGPPSRGFVFTNNCSRHNDFGIIGDNAGVGSRSLSVYFPNATVQRNALAGGKAADYPADNLFPASLDAVGFLVVGDAGHYKLSSTSPLQNAGLDGADIGCDLRRVWGKEGVARSGTSDDAGAGNA